MRYILVRASVVATLICGTGFAFALSTGPEAARTGAFKVQNKNAESLCTNCHTGSPVNDPSGSLRILGIPPSYMPNQIYPITLRLEHIWNPVPPTPLRWGFQMQAVAAATGDSIGAWIMIPNAPPDTFKITKTTSTSVYKNRRYIEHTRNAASPVDPNGSTHYDEPGPVEWHLEWRAPAGDSGKVYFFAAGNSANGDGVSIGSGDFIFTTAESTVGSSNVDVPPHPAPLQLRSAIEPPYPNPMVKCTGISFTIARGGLVDVSIYDLQGRSVRTVLREFREAGSHGATWDGRSQDGQFAKNGVYLIRMSAPDGRKVSQKVVLSR